MRTHFLLALLAALLVVGVTATTHVESARAIANDDTHARGTRDAYASLADILENGDAGTRAMAEALMEGNARRGTVTENCESAGQPYAVSSVLRRFPEVCGDTGLDTYSSDAVMVVELLPQSIDCDTLNGPEQDDNPHCNGQNGSPGVNVIFPGQRIIYRFFKRVNCRGNDACVQGGPPNSAQSRYVDIVSCAGDFENDGLNDLLDMNEVPDYSYNATGILSNNTLLLDGRTFNCYFPPQSVDSNLGLTVAETYLVAPLYRLRLLPYIGNPLQMEPELRYGFLYVVETCGNPSALNATLGLKNTDPDGNGDIATWDGGAGTCTPLTPGVRPWVANCFTLESDSFERSNPRPTGLEVGVSYLDVSQPVVVHNTPCTESNGARVAFTVTNAVGNPEDDVITVFIYRQQGVSAEFQEPNYNLNVGDTNSTLIFQTISHLQNGDVDFVFPGSGMLTYGSSLWVVVMNRQENINECQDLPATGGNALQEPLTALLTCVEHNFYCNYRVAVEVDPIPAAVINATVVRDTSCFSATDGEGHVSISDGVATTLNHTMSNLQFFWVHSDDDTAAVPSALMGNDFNGTCTAMGCVDGNAAPCDFESTDSCGGEQYTVYATWDVLDADGINLGTCDSRDHNSTDNVVVFRPDEFSINATASSNTCPDNALETCDGSVDTVRVGGPAALYSVTGPGRGRSFTSTYAWSCTGNECSDVSAETGSSLTDVCKGTYEVTATDTDDGDGSTCIATDDDTVTAPDDFDFDEVDVDDLMCFGDLSGAISIDGVEGGTAPYRYLWTTDRDGVLTDDGCLGATCDPDLFPASFGLLPFPSPCNAKKRRWNDASLRADGRRALVQHRLGTRLHSGVEDTPEVITTAPTPAITGPPNDDCLLVQDLPSVLPDPFDIVAARDFEYINGTLRTFSLNGTTVEATYTAAHGGLWPGACQTGTPDQDAEDVWYEYLHDGTEGVVTFSTCGSGYDTTIGVYLGCTTTLVGSGAPEGCNDGGCVGADPGSVVTIPVTAGNIGDAGRFMIRVSGRLNNDPGDFTLKVVHQFPMPPPLDNNPASLIANNMNSLSGIPSGNYRVLVRDDRCCTANFIHTSLVSQPSPLAINTSVAASACQSTLGLLTINDITGGTGALTYAWDGDIDDPGKTGSFVRGAGPVDVEAGAGTYNVTVTDANMCVINATEIVSQPGDVTIVQVAAINNTCFGERFGGLEVSARDGVYPNVLDSPAYGPAAIGYAFLEGVGDIPDDWYGPTATQASIEASPFVRHFEIDWNPTYPLPAIQAVHDAFYAGNVTVAVFVINYDPNGDLQFCVNSAVAGTAVVHDPPELVFVNVTTANPGCPLGTDGFFNVTVGGGTPFSPPQAPGGEYAYQWNTGEQVAAITDLSAGNYTVIVEDANMCRINMTAEIVPPTEPVQVTLVKNDTTCVLGADGRVEVHVSGGWSTATSEFDYELTPCPSVNHTIVGLRTLGNVTCSGSYNASNPYDPSNPFAVFGSTDKYVGLPCIDGSPGCSPGGAQAYTLRILNREEDAANDCVLEETFTVSEPPCLDSIISSLELLTPGAAVPVGTQAVFKMTLRCDIPTRRVISWEELKDRTTFRITRSSATTELTEEQLQAILDGTAPSSPDVIIVDHVDRVTLVDAPHNGMAEEADVLEFRFAQGNITLFQNQFANNEYLIAFNVHRVGIWSLEVYIDVEEVCPNPHQRPDKFFFGPLPSKKRGGADMIPFVSGDLSADPSDFFPELFGPGFHRLGRGNNRDDRIVIGGSALVFAVSLGNVVLANGECDRFQCCHLVSACISDLRLNLDATDPATGADWRTFVNNKDLAPYLPGSLQCPYEVCSTDYEYDSITGLCVLYRGSPSSRFPVHHTPYRSLDDCMKDYSRSSAVHCTRPLERAYYRCKKAVGMA